MLQDFNRDPTQGQHPVRRGRRLLCLALSLLPLLLVTVLYRRLPAQVPIHFGFDGAVTYGPRSVLWGLALISPLLHGMFVVLPGLDPRRRSYDRFFRYYEDFELAILLLMLSVMGITLSESLVPGRISVGRTVSLLVGVLFVVIGNLMPQVKSNFFFGVRTPWTLSDRVVWFRTHRLAGRLFFVEGLLYMAGGLLVTEERILFALLLSTTLLTALVPMAASWKWYRQREQNPAQSEESGPPTPKE